jgi:hypothetical protein
MRQPGHFVAPRCDHALVIEGQRATGSVASASLPALSPSQGEQGGSDEQHQGAGGQPHDRRLPAERHEPDDAAPRTDPSLGRRFRRVTTRRLGRVTTRRLGRG